MPQFDPTSFPSQIFWLAVTFYVLYRLMSDKVLPRIAEILEERSDRITNDLEQAESLKTSAEEVIKAYEDELARARTQATAAIAQVQNEVGQYAAQRQAEEAAKWAERVAQAEARIESEKTAAQAELRTIAVEVSSDLTAKLIGSAPNAKATAASVDAALREYA